MLIPLILSGGSGTRLWPVSRKNLPKQFLALAGDSTLFQQTLERTRQLPDVAPPIVVASDDHRFLAADQLLDLGIDNATIVLEPLARNTAPAIALGALQALRRGGDPLLLVLPADHLIGDKASFVEAVKQAIPLAEQSWLVTFGIRPDRPETGFGYIRRAGAINKDGFQVEQFVEKPDLATAETYLADGGYDWNSGMFLFKASRYLEELAEHAPEMLAAVREADAKSSTDLDFVRIDQETFSQVPDRSIDYAVMEKTRRAAVIPVSCAWSDIGSWSALWLTGQKDADGNMSEGDTLAIDTHNSLLRSHDRHLVATVGVDDLIVVTTPDATLVAHRDAAQDVKRIVEQLKASGRTEHSLHRVVHRPWGSYDSLEARDRFQVKRIVVKPGASLSLQKHHHRAEHWIVVSGTAEVTCDEKVFLLGENQSTYIPLGSVHRLRNPGKVPVELIEVQSGSYLGEDDIVRFDDVYGRC
ncbi:MULTISPECIES: mannose-1-phosphate guanylyltransferase/mannose-6-phosphate isomerase [unclassified Rhodanobacter]|jgi:mannose-1-phosphate guanylyltransferase / mannose-6-phosphate isomerase|uniref:mannose-1-phosphate guanylyltransferase/mannose-6-phosphate isomerase n=1 Tax=unclassified Rhodanobacter TaxID=2621553 RepID=UPI001606F762|nr:MULTISPECIES: mannose-1-phosphate guanylyltransferase/mannose-6-phosphate isomerase [unclassified Rhodanobacter]MBB6242653.1 mannose-1-phosphate guanylyltransferase/mannose-6-phosphate isomerase [Rhodanobacter sp. MP1X3]MBB6245193.1 mannose-1-phosphate guanylyltransferase/mannose-6-phosphate isomerase [Rhodanobacter sp. A1T4]